MISNLGHLVSIGSNVRRDAEKHLDVLPHFFWDFVEQSWADVAQLHTQREFKNAFMQV